MNNEKKYKVIFHIDMNMFFCSLAVIKNPSLKGKAFACARSNTIKGVISSASYKAREKGIRSAMSLVEAFRIMPDLICVEPDIKMINEYHNHFISVVRDYTKIIEVASVDELYADMSEICLTRSALDVAYEIQTRLVKEFHLPSSIGIAPTLFLAKMASDMKKPLGLVVIRKRDAKNILGPLSVKEIFGIGKKTYPILIENNIKTINDFLNLNNKDKIISLIGINSYNYVIDSVSGNSTNIVKPDRYAKSDSISRSITFDNHINSISELMYEMRNLVRDVTNKIKREKLMTKTVTLTLRDDSFKTISRSNSINYTNEFYEIYSALEDLLEENFSGQVIRLIGVSLSNLKNAKEVLKEDYNLFTFESYIEKEEKMKKTLKELENKFGVNIIRKGIKKEE